MNIRQPKFFFVSLLVMAVGMAVSASANHGDSSPSIPLGLEIHVRVNDNLSSETAKPGDHFQGTLETPIVVHGRNLYPKGASVRGEVTAVHRSGRLTDPGVLDLVLTSVASGGISSPLMTETFHIQGVSHTKNNVTKIGGGTAAGAIIGALVGGGKGAAIGAGVGAGAGTATAAATGKKPAIVESEAVLIFVSSSGQVASPPRRSDTSRDREGEHYVEHRHPANRDDDDDDDDHGGSRFPSRRGYDDGYSFGERDREVLQGCLAGYDFESLPPGIQKKLARGGTLPPGQAKKLRSLPDSCTARLSRPPRGVVRIIFGDRVVLVDGSDRILDILIFAR